MTWFSRLKKAEARDLIWLTAEAKLNGIVIAVRDITRQGSSVLLVAHFEQTLSEVTEALREAGIGYSTVDRLISPSTFQEPAAANPEDAVRVCLSERIPALKCRVSPDIAGYPFSLLVAERYPVPERDDRILQFAYAYGLKDEVCFCSSLDDPLLKQFGAGRVMGAIRRLAEDEASPIAGKAITSAIKSAQRKLRGRVVGDERVRSAKDWFTYNMPRHGVLS